MVEETEIDNKVKNEIRSLIDEIANGQISKEPLRKFIENHMKIFKIKELKYSEIPNKNGVYLVVDKYRSILKQVTNIGENASKQGYRESEIEVLEEKIKRLDKNANSFILYIGKAEKSNKLKGRLRQYFGNGKNHKGGKEIKLLNNYRENLYVCWIEEENAEILEEELILQYAQKYKEETDKITNIKTKKKYYPFANKRK